MGFMDFILTLLGLGIKLAFVDPIIEGRIIPIILFMVIWGLFFVCVLGHKIPMLPIRKGIRVIGWIVLFVLLVFCMCGRSWIPGIYYPSKQYRIVRMEVKPPIDIIFLGGETYNSFEKGLNAMVFTDKEHEIVRLKKIQYEWDGNIGDFLKEKEIIELKPYLVKSGFKDGWYKDENVGNFVRRIEFSRFNPEKLFKGKEVGDTFKFYLKVVYSFDDEPEEIVILEYDVEVIKGKYQPSFTGF